MHKIFEFKLLDYMKILYICASFPPYTFSESLCNGKLVFALIKNGIDVDVISKIEEGKTYSSEWKEPWTPLRTHTNEIHYKPGSKLVRILDILWSSIYMRTYPIEGIRWARRAYQKSVKLLNCGKYDAIFTRSPSDIPHIVGYKLSKKTGIKWIANWNDPAAPIWPEPYTHHYPKWKQFILNKYTEKCLRLATYNSFPSEFLMLHFKEFYPFINAKRNLVIPHIGLHKSIFPKTSSHCTNQTFRICHSGNLSTERDPRLLFQVLKGLLNGGYKIQFDIMGYINDYVKQLISEYGLQDNVRFIGSYSYIDALVKMSEYDILVLIEAIMEKGIFFPSKFTDYAQLGIPILAVSPKNGFAHDMLNRFKGGIAVDNNNIESIKDGITTLYASWQNNTMSTEYSSNRLFNNFSTERIVGTFKTIL